MQLRSLALFLAIAPLAPAQTISGRVLDPQGSAVPGARVSAAPAGGGVAAKTGTDPQGRYDLVAPLAAGRVEFLFEAPGFAAERRELILPQGAGAMHLDVRFRTVAGQSESVAVTARVLEPATDVRGRGAYESSLLVRDDQILGQLSPGIDAGQHEGGGKSVEIRRFGFNLDHGGANGGLEVLVDGVPQNQGTQGHGQGYLGSLKAISPELIDEVVSINGPFNAEYGDFSGLGVVEIRQRESLPDPFTVRLERGSYRTSRGFIAYSPELARTNAYLAYDGSNTDGPFQNPGRYRRDNVNANYSRNLSETEKVGFRFLFGRNRFYSSGQLPLDLVSSGALDRFGYIDPTDGGRVWLGTAAVNYSKDLGGGRSLRANGFLSRSLFDLYSNFTWFLHDPVRGDAIQQHDSRLSEGAGALYTDPRRLAGMPAVLVAGVNLLESRINVGLYPRQGRTPDGVETRAHARVDNAAGFVQENASAWNGRLLLGAGLRYDAFRFAVSDFVSPEQGGTQSAGRWQAKGAASITPLRAVPFTVHLNYGRGINSADARAVVARPQSPRVAATDFYQVGASSSGRRLGISADAFLIDHSNEQVYIPDDGSFEFKGPSRAYGFEAKLSAALTRRVSLDGGFTKVLNAFYRGGSHRVYVDSAPHFVANAALRVTGWRQWSGALGMRAISHYRLDGELPSIAATGHTVFDLHLTRPIRRGVDFNLAIDNLTNRRYYETQNFFESRISPAAAAVSRIHGTPGYPLTVIAGLALRFR